MAFLIPEGDCWTLLRNSASAFSVQSVDVLHAPGLTSLTANATVALGIPNVSISVCTCSLNPDQSCLTLVVRVCATVLSLILFIMSSASSGFALIKMLFLQRFPHSDHRQEDVYSNALHFLKSLHYDEGILQIIGGYLIKPKRPESLDPSSHNNCVPL